MPFVSKTGFLNSDGSTFTAHIATNVSSSLASCCLCSSLHVFPCPFPGWGCCPGTLSVSGQAVPRLRVQT